jgi:hypothetical protein
LFLIPWLDGSACNAYIVSMEKDPFFFVKMFLLIGAAWLGGFWFALGWGYASIINMLICVFLSFHLTHKFDAAWDKK